MPGSADADVPSAWLHGGRGDAACSGAEDVAFSCFPAAGVFRADHHLPAPIDDHVTTVTALSMACVPTATSDNPTTQADPIVRLAVHEGFSLDSARSHNVFRRQHVLAHHVASEGSLPSSPSPAWSLASLLCGGSHGACCPHTSRSDFAPLLLPADPCHAPGRGCRLASGWRHISP